MKRKAAKVVSQTTQRLTNGDQDISSLYKQQEYDAVIVECNIRLLTVPGDVNILYYKALACNCLDRNEEADICIREILAINPEHKGAIIFKTSRDFDKDFTGSNRKLSDELLTKIQQYVQAVSANQALLSGLQRMSSTLEGHLQTSVVDCAVSYQQVFAAEIAKQEQEPNYLLDDKAIRAAREALVQNNNNLAGLEILEKEAKLLEKEFPEEFTKFSRLFKLLARIENNREFEQQLKQISVDLGISYDFLEKIYKINNATKQIPDSGIAPEQLSLEELESQLPAYKKSIKSPDIKPLGQILAELVIGTDKEGYVAPEFTSAQIKKFRELEQNIEQALMQYKSDYANNPEILKLIDSFQQVKKYYESWQNSSLNSIRAWADAKKGSLPNSIDATCEAIAVMDRANELVTGGHYLRDTQVIATLAFLQSENGQGKLCQIRTGEGKTTIVSLLAVIKVLQGETVDIITSNPILAEEGVKEKKSFYAVFNLTAETNNNDPKYVSGPRECYKADILYGSISNFQFDYLRDSFERLQTRAERKFGVVILDEVDSMLIDNGGNIAKLSGPLPGMESLRYVYITIWTELAKAEAKVTNDLNNQLTNQAKELAYKAESGQETQKEFYQFRQEQLKSVRAKIKDLIKASNPHKIELIPAHIQEYARDKLDRWIDNAIYAKYSCHENEQYVIKKKNSEDGNSEKVLIPVDYANTGITLKNTIWSHGLHQFVQLKHNLHLTAESLTSSFISNVGYIKHYGDKIFGLTGTLGSVAEQKLLSKMYNVSYAKIPTFKAKDFTENKGYVVDDEDWDIYMAADALEKCEAGRAVLIICETIADVKNIEDNLNKLKIIAKNKGEELRSSFNVKIFTDEDLAHVTEDKLGPGDIIIATNIAGRGTDLGTTEELEANGGLHVCVGFLPCNQRVEEQAFGRTARQGKKGTAQLILRKSEVLSSIDEYYDFEVIKHTRDKLEQERIKEIEEKKLKELNFNDALFDKFSELYVKLKEANDEEIGFLFVLQDLKEYWAFWLEQQDFKLDSAELNGKVEEEFNRFKTSNTSSSIISGHITHNPYYSVKQAESYLQSDNKVDEALKSLKRAVDLGATNPDILYSAYIKLFEVAIEQGEQLKERFKKAVAQCFFVKVGKNEKYKEEAKDWLERAKKALEKEIKYLSSYFEEKSEFSRVLIGLEEGEDNLLTKHLLSRLYCLQTYSNNIEGLLKSIEQFSDGVSIASKVPNYLKKLDSNNMHEKDLKDRINDAEVSELSFVSLDAIYALKEVHDASEKVILRAQAQIGGGLASLAIGLGFPPALPICGPVAGALIGEGVCDIVMELISQGNEEFSEAEYAKGKAISYGISIATMGISAIATSMKILSAASKACKGFAKLLSKSPFLKTICTKVSKSLEKLGKWFDKLHLEQFNKLSQAKQLEHLEKLQKVGNLEELRHLGGVEKLSSLKHLKEAGKFKELSRIQHLSEVIKNIAIESGQDVVGSVVMEKVVMVGLQELLQKLKLLIKEKVKSEIEDNSSLKDELKTVSREVIVKDAQEVLTDEMSKIIGEVAKEIVLGVAQNSHNWKVKLTSLTIDSIVSVDQILKYAKEFAEQLLSKLSAAQDNLNDGTSNLNGIIEELSEQATEKIYSLVINLVRKHAQTFVVGPIMQKGSEKLFDGSKKSPAELENSLALRADKESPKTKTDRAYEILGLDPKTATPQEIRKAYHMLALKNHPDKGGSHEAMQRIINAYNEIRTKTTIYGQHDAHHMSESTSGPGENGATNKTGSDATPAKENIVFAKSPEGQESILNAKNHNNKEPKKSKSKATDSTQENIDLNDPQNTKFGALNNTQVDDVGNGGNCRHIGIAQLFNEIESGGGKKHTASSIVKGFGTTPTPGRLKVLDKILQTQYQDMVLIKDTLSPLELKTWMQRNNFNNCLLAVEFKNPNGGDALGHVTWAKLDTNGEVIICDRQVDRNGDVILDMSMTDYFESIGSSPERIHVRQLIDSKSITSPIIVTADGKLLGDGVDQLKEDNLVRLIKRISIAEADDQNPSDHRNSTDMDVDFETLIPEQANSSIEIDSSGNLRGDEGVDQLYAQDLVHILEKLQISEKTHDNTSAYQNSVDTDLNASEKYGVRSTLPGLSGEQTKYVENTLFPELEKYNAFHGTKDDIIRSAHDYTLHVDIAQLPGTRDILKLEVQSTENVANGGPHRKPTYFQVIYNNNHPPKQIIEGLKKSFNTHKVVDLRSDDTLQNNREVRTGNSRTFSNFQEAQDELNNLKGLKNNFRAPKDNLERINESIELFKTFKDIDKNIKSPECTDLYKQVLDLKLHFLEKQTSIFESNNDAGKNNARIEQNNEEIAELQLELDQLNTSGEGFFEYNTNFWNKYFRVAMEEILKLRIIQDKVENVKVLACSILEKGVFDIKEKLSYYMSSFDNIKILMPININNKHWVGLFIEQKEQLAKVIYIDSENQNIPKHILFELSFILSNCNIIENVEISQMNVEQQRCNNCGPELIENFMLLLSGGRYSQEDAVIEHSNLLEQSLLKDPDQLIGNVIDIWYQ